jgi:hypothetical protein
LPPRGVEQLERFEQPGDAAGDALGPRLERVRAGGRSGAAEGQFPHQTAELVGPVGGKGDGPGFARHDQRLPAVGAVVSEFFQERAFEAHRFLLRF